MIKGKKKERKEREKNKKIMKNATNGDKVKRVDRWIYHRTVYLLIF